MNRIERYAFRQGQFDGLCGFYSALNAISVLFPKLLEDCSPDERKPYKAEFDRNWRRQMIFDQAIDLLSRVGGVSIKILQGNPAVGGIDQFQIQELLNKMSSYWGLGFQTALLHELEKQDLAQFLVEQRRRGRFALVCERDGGSHWAAIYETRTRTLGVLDPAGHDYDISPTRALTNVNHESGVLIQRN